MGEDVLAQKGDAALDQLQGHIAHTDPQIEVSHARLLVLANAFQAGLRTTHEDEFIAHGFSVFIAPAFVLLEEPYLLPPAQARIRAPSR